jgi:hypothetical protein
MIIEEEHVMAEDNFGTSPMQIMWGQNMMQTRYIPRRASNHQESRDLYSTAR